MNIAHLSLILVIHLAHLLKHDNAIACYLYGMIVASGPRAVVTVVALLLVAGYARAQDEISSTCQLKKVENDQEVHWDLNILTKTWVVRSFGACVPPCLPPITSLANIKHADRCTERSKQLLATSS